MRRYSLHWHRRNHYHKLALDGALLKLRQEVSRRTAQEFFEFLGQFAREDNVAVGIDVGEFFQHFEDAIGRFVKDERAGNGF